MALEGNKQLTFRLGAAFDDTNRDDSELSLIGDVTLNTQNSKGFERTFYLSYAAGEPSSGLYSHWRQ